jgi:hypothetical protein
VPAWLIRIDPRTAVQIESNTIACVLIVVDATNFLAVPRFLGRFYRGIWGGLMYTRSCYAILQVPEDADKATIDRAFRAQTAATMPIPAAAPRAGFPGCRRSIRSAQ